MDGDLALAFGVDDVCDDVQLGLSCDGVRRAWFEAEIDAMSDGSEGPPSNDAGDGLEVDALIRDLGIEDLANSIDTDHQRVVPEGIPNHSLAHMTLISRSRFAKTPDRGKIDYNALADLHDSRTLRFGDLAGGCLRQVETQLGEKGWTHSNTYTASGTIRAGFKQIGRLEGSLRGEVDLDSCRRQQEGLVTVSALTESVWKEAAEKYKDQIMGRKVKYLRRHHDATPVLLRFGALQDEIAPFARYIKPILPDRDNGYIRYTTCTYEEFVKMNPNVTPNMGVVEVFAQTAHVVTSDICSDLSSPSGQAALRLECRTLQAHQNTAFIRPNTD